MVAVSVNPLFIRQYYKKFRSTVITVIWPEMLVITLVGCMVTLVSELTSTSLAISNQMLTVLGTVLGLVISFRTSTAYERFSEGRKLWTNIIILSQILAQIIWIHVPFDRVDKTTGQKRPMLRVIIEKKSMINLVQAYSVSTKHLLRGEGGVYYEDLYPLISFLPRFSTNVEVATEEDMLPLWKASGMDHSIHKVIHETSFGSGSKLVNRVDSVPVPSREDSFTEKDFHKTTAETWIHSTAMRGPSHKRKSDPENCLPVLPSEHPLKPACDPPNHSFIDYFPFLRIFKLVFHPFRRRLSQLYPEQPSAPSAQTFSGKKTRPNAADSNVPTEITLFLTTYYTWLMNQGLLTPASATAMNNAIASLQDAVINLERIKNTPLPFAYQAHLRMSLWLYLLFLPFQIYSTFGWLTIPATVFTSFLTLGFLEIGQEIENPFNYEANDLDLDHFCLTIARELHEITAHPTPDPDTFLYTDWNQPLAPADRRGARTMMEDAAHAYHDKETGMRQMQRTLLQSWRDVDTLTRQ